MKTQTIINGVILGAAILAIAGCSSTKGGKGGMAGADGANGYGNGAYAEGMGSGSEFYNTQNCSVPQSGGMNTQAFYFDFNSNAINSEDRNRLQSLAQNLASNHNHVQVVGNTDNRGSREYNVALGWRRADAVASTLEQYGLSKQQINTTSNGAEKPIAYGNSEQDYQCNRRVDTKAGN